MPLYQVKCLRCQKTSQSFNKQIDELCGHCRFEELINEVTDKKKEGDKVKMRLYEKLAFEYAKRADVKNAEWMAVEEGFIAGFRMARDLAVRASNYPSLQSVPSEAAFANLKNYLARLGETEVAGE